MFFFFFLALRCLCFIFIFIFSLFSPFCGARIWWIYAKYTQKLSLSLLFLHSDKALLLYSVVQEWRWTRLARVKSYGWHCTCNYRLRFDLISSTSLRHWILISDMVIAVGWHFWNFNLTPFFFWTIYLLILLANLVEFDNYTVSVFLHWLIKETRRTLWPTNYTSFEF